MNIQDNIIEILSRLNISQAELARRCNVPQPNINRILRGTSKPQQATINKIAIALGVSVNEIVRKEEEQDNTVSEVGSLVVGYIDYKGKVIRCNNFKELKHIVLSLEKEIEGIEKTRKEVERKNKANKKKVEAAPSPDFSTIDISTTKTIDCASQRVWAFRKSEDEIEEDGEVIENKLGNMASGFPFCITIGGETFTFSNSEALYICGAFSNPTPQHYEIQKELIADKSGYSAKKNVRRKHESEKRADWVEFNIEWMKFTIRQKTNGSKAFRELLKKIPTDAVILENSTFQQKKGENDTSAFWGARNEELKAATKVVEDYIDYTHPYDKKASTDKLKMKMRNELQYIGKYVGVNAMGGILKMAQLYLLYDIPMPINYDLLRSKEIYLFGHKMDFLTPNTNNDISVASIKKGMPSNLTNILNAFGAIIGDVVGSIYERKNTKDYRFKLFKANSTYTDDTVLTLAVAKWILEDPAHEAESLIRYLQYFGRKYPKNRKVYGKSFKEWLLSDNPQPYNSYGNGSAMRVGYIGMYAKSIEEASLLAEITASVSHNHEEGIKGAVCIAECVWLAANGYSKQEILENASRHYNMALWRLDDLNDYGFSAEASRTVPIAISAFVESKDAMDCLRKAVSIGGDSDTIAAMACSIALPFYKQTLDASIYERVWNELDTELQDICVEAYSKTKHSKTVEFEH